MEFFLKDRKISLTQYAHSYFGALTNLNIRSYGRTRRMKQADATDRTPSAIKTKAPETKTKVDIRFCVFRVVSSWILALRCSLVCTLMFLCSTPDSQAVITPKDHNTKINITIFLALSHQRYETWY